MAAKRKSKILKVGTSQAVTIPVDSLRGMNLKAGDLVEITYDEYVVIKPLEASHNG